MHTDIGQLSILSRLYMNIYMGDAHRIANIQYLKVKTNPITNRSLAKGKGETLTVNTTWGIHYRLDKT